MTSDLLVASVRTVTAPARWVSRHRRDLAGTLLLAGLVASVAIAGPLDLGDYLGETGEEVDAYVSDAAGDVSDLLFDRPVGSSDDRDPGPNASVPREIESINETALERAVHAEINGVRADHGLDRLRFDAELAEVARYHSGDMARKDYFAHTAPDGETMQERYRTFGYTCRVRANGTEVLTGGENIAATWWRTPIGGGQFHDDEAELAASIVDGWMNSEGHRRNVLTPEWRREGIGVSTVWVNGTAKVYVTQNFC